MLTEPLAITYRWPELRRLCLRIARTVRTVSLAGHTINILDIRPYQVIDGWQIGVHAHSFYESHIFLQGNGAYSLEHEYAIGPGSVVLHAPQTPHSWRADSRIFRLVFWMDIDPAIAVPVPEEWPVYPDVVTEIALLLDDAYAMLPGWRDRLRFLVSTILSKILACVAWEEPVLLEQEPENTVIATIDHFLRDNIAQPLMVADVATHVGMSVSNIAHQFPKLTGLTVMQRLFQIRMDRVAELLTESDITLADIGAQVGIPDPSYLCRRFRQHFGVTPNQYRQKVAAVEIE